MLPIEITMSISAMYELIEWAVADVFFPEQGDAYLGLQGDIWDAQKDIFLAFSGAIIATTIVSLIKRLGHIYYPDELADVQKKSWSNIISHLLHKSWNFNFFLRSSFSLE